MHINSPLNLNMDDKQVHADDVKSTHSTATTNVTLLSMNESDLHCVEHYLSSSKNKGWKNFKAWTGFEPMTSVISMQCSTNWANKPTGSWSLCWHAKNQWGDITQTRDENSEKYKLEDY